MVNAICLTPMLIPSLGTILTALVSNPELELTNLSFVACEDFHLSSSCESAKRMFPRISNCINEVETHLATFDTISEVDRARTVLKCLALYEARPNDVLELLNELTAVNMVALTETSKSVFADTLLCRIIPPGLSIETFAQILGVLNTNCHTLEDIGGSGLFLTTCRCQHSCAANCNFTTHGTELTLTAIKPIPAGVSLTLDYGENFCKPTKYRQSFLQESYGFTCKCEKCTGVVADRCRSFLCPESSVEGFEHAVFAPKWECICGYKLSDVERAECEKWESYCQEEESLFEWGGVETLLTMSENRLHKFHYLLFEIIDDVAHEMAMECTIEYELEMVWKLLLQSLEFIVPENHPIKVNYYDEFAQVYVKVGNIPQAKLWYEKAYRMGLLMIGPEDECSSVNNMKNLWMNTPLTVHQLHNCYRTKDIIENELKFNQQKEETQQLLANVQLS